MRSLPYVLVSAVVAGASSVASAQVGTATVADAPVDTRKRAKIREAVYVGLGVGDAAGVVVTAVVQGGPASASGFAVGDEVVALDGTPVNNKTELVGLLAGREPGDTVAFLVRSNEGTVKRTVTLATRPAGAPPLGGRLPPPKVIRTKDTDWDVTDDFGLELSYTDEKVTLVGKPVDDAHLFTWNMDVYLSIGGQAETTSGGGGFGYRYLNPSGNFPGPDGGTSHMFSLASRFSFRVGGSEPIDIGIGPVIQPGVTLTGQLTGSPAYTFMYFLGLDRESGRQSGYGFSLGATAGISFVGQQIMSSFDTSVSPVIGPLISFDMMDFNPGTAKVRAFTLSFFILPINGVSLNVGVGGSF